MIQLFIEVKTLQYQHDNSDQEVCGPVYAIVTMNVIAILMILLNIGHISFLFRTDKLLKTAHGQSVLW